MNPDDIPIFALWAALAVGLLASLGETLHARRVGRLGTLAFGPAGRPRGWTVLVPVVRVVSLAVLAWSLVTLVGFSNRSRERDIGNNVTRHLVVLLDVSPSMLLADAGENRQLRRARRASDVLKSVLDRVPGDNVRFTAAGFYTEARMLVRDCRDRELILHLTNETPFHLTYRPGKTDLLASLNQTGELIKDLPRKSTTLLVLSDGDTVAPTGLKPMPSSVSKVIFAGVGDPGRGTFIDGHLSRQDTANLSQLARRLGGEFHDCNVLHIPGDALRSLTEEDPNASKWRNDRRVLALVVLAASTLLLCLLPLMLEYLGSRWRPVARSPKLQPQAAP